MHYGVFMHTALHQLNIALDAVKEENRQLQEQLADAQKTTLSLRRMIDQQRRQLDALLLRLSGKKGENLHPDQQVFEALLLDVLKESQTALDEAAQDVTPDPEPKTRAKPKKKHRGRCPLPDHLERHSILVDIPDDEKIDPITGKPLRMIRIEKTEKLDIIPTRLRVNVYERPVYALPDGKGIVIADLPVFPIDKCKADNGYLADIAVKRFVDHQPYYRQAEGCKRDNIPLHRNHINNWMLRLGDDVLTGLYEVLTRDVLSHDYVGFDDSGIKLQVKGAGKLHSARMWICRAGIGPPHVFFRFTLTKEKEEATALLGDFQGYAQADAYGGHDEVMGKDGIIEVGCWAHAIRRFKDAVLSHPVDAPKLLELTSKLYDVEREAKSLTADERHVMRQKKSLPVINTLFEKFNDLKLATLPKSPLAEAVNYCLNQEQPLRRYLEDGRLSIDNNHVERGIRPLGIGRKNWLFAGSERGGRTAAVFMSLFASCRNMKINPWLYMKDILDRIVTHPHNQLKELLPGYWKPLQRNTELGVPIYLNYEDDREIT